MLLINAKTEIKYTHHVLSNSSDTLKTEEGYKTCVRNGKTIKYRVGEFNGEEVNIFDTEEDFEAFRKNNNNKAAILAVGVVVGGGVGGAAYYFIPKTSNNSKQEPKIKK